MKPKLNEIEFFFAFIGTFFLAIGVVINFIDPLNASYLQYLFPIGAILVFAVIINFAHRTFGTIFVVLAIFLALLASFLGIPAGCYSNYTETQAGAGNTTYTQGLVVTLFGQVVYTYTYYSITAPVHSFPSPDIPWGGIAIAFMINLAIASGFLAILWQIPKLEKRY